MSALDPATEAYLSEVLGLDPAEDGNALDLILARRAQLGLTYPPAYPPPFAHFPARVRTSAWLDELRAGVRAGQAPEEWERLAADVRGLGLPDQVAQLERILAYAAEREGFLRLRGLLGPELSEVLETAWLAQTGVSVPVAEAYVESLDLAPRAPARLGEQVATIRRALPRLAALEPELLRAMERRARPSRGEGPLRAALALAVAGLVYLTLELLLR